MSCALCAIKGVARFVNRSSLGGLVGLRNAQLYHGTKHAVLGMTKSAGVEGALRGIRINAVCPGTIDTPMVADMLEGQADAMAEIMKQQSIGRLGRAEQVAAAVLWLVQPGGEFLGDRRRPAGRRRLHGALRTTPTDMPISDLVRAFSLTDLAGGATITRRRTLVAGGGLARWRQPDRRWQRLCQRHEGC